MPIVKNLQSSQVRELPDFKVGNVVKVHQRIKEGGKERVQIFEGVVLARKGGKGVNGTFTVRKIASGVGVERIYPVHSPNIVKLEIVKAGAVKQAKIYYIRELRDNTPRYKKDMTKVVAKKKPAKKASK